MLPQPSAKTPDKKTRRQRREDTLAQRRMHKKIRRKLLPVTFDNTTVTEAANFQFIEVFKHLIGLSHLVNQHLTVARSPNCVYATDQLIDHLVDCIVLGHTRFSHIEALQFDPGYQIVKGLDRFPDESTFRKFLSELDAEHLSQLIAVNRALLHQKARGEETRLIWIDIDDTVITLFGEQEGGAVGYNPRYHGRPSLKARVGFISGTGELLHVDLCSGNNHGMKDFLTFIQEIEALLPPQYIIEGIRADCGFADPAVMEYAEQQGWSYIFKLPKKATVKKAIAYLQQHPAFWESLAEEAEEIRFATEDDHWAAADIPILLGGWERARRCVIYRESHETEQTTQDQLTLMLTTYTFQAIITNTEDKPLPLLRSYNQRANVENRIDELKEGYAVEQNSQHALLRNQIFCQLKVLAYNLVTWFKQVALPDEMQTCEIKTVRRAILKIPGNVVGSGRYRHIRMPEWPRLREIVETMTKKLEEWAGQRRKDTLACA